MIDVPSTDPVHALVPHTLKKPLVGKPAGLLAGTTFMVKDLFQIEGHKTGNGNPNAYLHATPASETAPAIKKLLEAGASLTGVTISDEFFYSVLGNNAHYGQPINARAPRHVTGGSSCGSAAAVASGMCDFALGSDTGGSTRVPASFSGLYGLRPTHGRIDTTEMTAMAPSYDTLGYLTREALLFRKVGHILLDEARVSATVERLVIPEDMLTAPDHEVAQAFWHSLDGLSDAFPKVEPVDLAGGQIEAWRQAFATVQGFEIQSTLLPFVQSHDVTLGPGIKERFATAANITFEEAEAARAVRADVARRINNIVQPGTALVLPTTPTLSPERGVPDGDAVADFRTKTLKFTCLAGHAGLPQMSVPASRAAGRPSGISFIAWEGGDEALLDLSLALEPMIGP